VNYTGPLIAILLNRSCDGLEICLGARVKECMKIFGGKTDTWKIEKEMGDTEIESSGRQAVSIRG
jgi:hypothetical protein